METLGKEESYTSQDKPFIQDVAISKLFICIDTTYAWLRLNKESSRETLKWLTVIPHTSTVPYGYLLEGLEFDKDPWSKRYKNYSPHNMREWASKNPISGHQFNHNTQDIYNHIVGIIKLYPLDVSGLYLNDGHETIQALLCNYINAYTWVIMARGDKQKLTSLKYHNDRG